MAGVLETAWQPGRSTHEGHAEFKVTVYWRLGGIRGGPGVRTVGELRGCMAVLRCPPDPSNNSGGA